MAYYSWSTLINIYDFSNRLLEGRWSYKAGCSLYIGYRNYCYRLGGLNDSCSRFYRKKKPNEEYPFKSKIDSFSKALT